MEIEMRYSIGIIALLLSGCMNPASMQKEVDEEWQRTQWVQSCENNGGSIVYISKSDSRHSHRKMSCLEHNQISQYESN